MLPFAMALEQLQIPWTCNSSNDESALAAIMRTFAWSLLFS